MFKGTDFVLFRDGHYLDATLKHSVKYTNWRKEPFDSLIMPPGYALHFDNTKLKDFTFMRLKERYPTRFVSHEGNVAYFKNSGVYKDDNINWVVYSLYQHNQRPEYVKEDGFYVGLFHGPIQGLSTDTGFEFETAYSPLNFVGLDLLLCGDIHKRQMFDLPNGGKAIMIGSLIQQNFGETINYHGYGIYDVESNEYTTVDIENEQPFLHFSISDITDLENGSEVLLNVR
jgi:DNA repair exonuclease SbcCD nuclease subunit